MLQEASAQDRNQDMTRPHYSKEEVYEATLEYFDGDQLAASTWIGKYALTTTVQDEKLWLEKTPEDMHRRIAREFARIEAKYPNPLSEEEIFGLLERFRYIIPQGSPMSGIGNTERLQSLGNCFVTMPPADSYGGILYSDQQLAQLMKRRAGVGLDISNLRPRGIPTANAAETSDGIGVFMERYSNTCREVGQNGRRGAEMITCSIHHPEVQRFIEIKNELSECRNCGHGERDKVTGANVSVKISDAFMRAVEADEDYRQCWPVDADTPQLERWVSASEVWDTIIHNAWASAEPGVLFWDNVITNSVPDIYASIDPRFKTTSTNPCGEIPLGLDSCRLLVVNVLSFVVNPYTNNAFFNVEKFREVVAKGQRLMDDLIDLEIEHIDRILAKIDEDPEEEHLKRVERDMWQGFRETASLGRRTGLGVTAIGDTLAALGIPYGSQTSIDMVEDIYRHLSLAARHSSCDLAQERGAFPLHSFELEKKADNPYLQRLWNEDPSLCEKEMRNGRRNIAILTTAPTGSVSILTQTTSGIEPLFSFSYTRKKKINASDGEDVRVDEVDASGDKWQHFEVLEHGPRRWSEITGKSNEEESPYYQATSADIDWVNRVKIQAAAQKWIDHSISSTVNLPEDVDEETVKTIYMTAWKAGCKGITIYRDGCRDGVLVTNKEHFHQHDAPKRQESLTCEIHRSRVVENGVGTDWILIVGLMEGKPYEVFGGLCGDIDIPRKITEGTMIKRSLKTGSKYDLHYEDGGEEKKVADVVSVFNNPNRGVFTRFVSLSLRHGTPIQYVVDQLLKDKNADLYSFHKVVARILKKYIPDGSKSSHKGCPQCGASELKYQEGCLSCVMCGWTKCG